MADKTYTQEEFDDKLKGITDKNTELIGDIKKLNKIVKGFDGIDLDLLKNQSTELAKLKEANLTDAERLENERNAINEKHTATKQALLDSEAKVLKMTKSHTIANALRDAGEFVGGNASEKEQTRLAVTSLIEQRITMSDDGVPMVGDSLVADYVKTFHEGAGKAFFAPKNSGGGGNGSGGGGASDSAKFFKKGGDDYSLTEQGKIAKSDPTLYKQLAGGK